VVVLLILCIAAGTLWWQTVRPAARHRQFLKHKYDGIALLNSGNYAGAKQELLLAYSMDANDDYVYYCLGESESHLGKWPYAINYYRQSLKLKPGTSYAQVALANALLQHGDLDDALAEYKTITSTDYALPLDPTTSAWVHNNYGDALLKKGDLNGAEQQFALAFKADPGWRSQLRDRIQAPPHSH